MLFLNEVAERNPRACYNQTLRGDSRECTGTLGRLAGLGPRAASHPAGGSRPALALCSGVRRPSACASRAAAEQGGTTRVQASDFCLQGGASLEVTGQDNEWEGREAGRDTQLRIEPCVNLIREQYAKCNLHPWGLVENHPQTARHELRCQFHDNAGQRELIRVEPGRCVSVALVHS
jgi:hypothetical protein